MKKLLFISALIFLGFSCKKQRLRKERDILVGEWQLEYQVKRYYNAKYGYYNADDTIYNTSNSPIQLVFEKNGKGSYINEGNTEEFKITFRTGKLYGDENSQFTETLEESFIRNKNGLISIGDYHSFYCKWHLNSSNTSIGIGGLVNENSLIFVKTTETMLYGAIYDNNATGTKYDNHYKRIK